MASIRHAALLQMESPETIVLHYLHEFRAGRCEDAFHSLSESNAEVVPVLINTFENIDDIDTKVFLIEVITEFRLESSLSFFRHTLLHEDPRIWKRALDGMAMAESPEAIDLMNQAFEAVANIEKRAWIEEAISDTRENLKQTQHTPA